MDPRDLPQSEMVTVLAPDAKFKGAGDGPLVQIPGTGVIWKICKTTSAPGAEDQGPDSK